MPEIVAESPLDRLSWLVTGKPTASQFEDLGGKFKPQFHFLALLPSPMLHSSEANKVKNYFDAMFEALLPVRDLIAALDPKVPPGAIALVDGIAVAPLNALGNTPYVRLEKAMVTA